jgi:hypothetical protein
MLQGAYQRAIAHSHWPAPQFRHHRHAPATCRRLAELRSTTLPRLQRVELVLIHAKLDRFFAELHIAIQLRVRQGLEAAEAVERGFRAMLAPLPRGSAGGLARARTAWRYLDGTFMPESEKEAAYLEEYERYARGGRARAQNAKRAPDGTFFS